MTHGPLSCNASPRPRGLLPHDPPEKRAGKTEDRRSVRTESRAPRLVGVTSASMRTSNILEALVAAQKLGRWNAMFSVVDHPTPSSRILNRVPNPMGPGVSFSTSSSFRSGIINLSRFDVLIATHSPQIIHDRWDLTFELSASGATHAT